MTDAGCVFWPATGTASKASSQNPHEFFLDGIAGRARRRFEICSGSAGFALLLLLGAEKPDDTGADDNAQC